MKTDYGCRTTEDISEAFIAVAYLKITCQNVLA
jgi:hypothetical protein